MITVQALSKSYGDGAERVDVLDAIDLSVRRGTIFAVVGPSGAGKSTLAHCINLLERPTSGTVCVDGRDLTALAAKDLRVARRAIGTVFQASSLLARRTAAENIALPLEFLGVTVREREARVAELLERVGLSDRANHRPHQLSGGQRQRAGIARALALRPGVLLADEATSGLDPEATSSVLGLLDELRRDLELTILLITHEMAAVREVADDAALLHDGRIVEQGSVLGLVTDPGSKLGRSLLPPRAEVQAPEGQDVWDVTYRQASVPPDWIDRISIDTGAPVSLLAAAVEPIAGVRTGRASVGITSTAAGRVPGLLTSLGLHGARVVSTAHNAVPGTTSSADVRLAPSPGANATTTRSAASGEPATTTSVAVEEAA